MAHAAAADTPLPGDRGPRAGFELLDRHGRPSPRLTGVTLDRSCSQPRFGGAGTSMGRWYHQPLQRAWNSGRATLDRGLDRTSAERDEVARDCSGVEVGRAARQADRERSRRALFEELAKRPPNICPFLGLATSQTEYHDGFTREHRCYAFGDPVELSAEQQERVCLGRGYGNCPRYLRGVLVIPTEELEALRRPLPPVGPPAPPARRRPARPLRRWRRPAPRPGPLIGAVLLLAVVGRSVRSCSSRAGSGVHHDPSPSRSTSVDQAPAPRRPQRRAVADAGSEPPDPVPGDAEAGPDPTARRHVPGLRGDRPRG